MASQFPRSGTTIRAGLTIYLRYLSLVVFLFMLGRIALPSGIDRTALFAVPAAIAFANLALHVWLRSSRRPVLGIYIFLILHLVPILVGIYYTGLLTSPFMIFLGASMFSVYFTDYQKEVTVKYGLVTISIFALLLFIWYLDDHAVLPWRPDDYPAFYGLAVTIQLIGFMHYAYHASRSNPLIKERARQEFLLATQARKADLGVSLSMIAHELRTPLTTLSLNVENFAGAVGRSQAPVRRRLLSILKSCRADINCLRDMMENTLSYARERRGAYRMTLCRLREIVDQAVAFHHLKYAGRGGILEINPAFPERAKVLADRDALFQVVVHLLERAYRQRIRGRPLRIELGYFRRKDSQTLSVRDNGQGIPAPGMAALGEALPNEETRKLWPDFAVTRQLVSDHGGNLDIQSDEAAGTTILLTLPAPKRRERSLGSKPVRRP